MKAGVRWKEFAVCCEGDEVEISKGRTPSLMSKGLMQYCMVLFLS